MNPYKPYVVAILIQLIWTGMFLLTKATFNGGMNTFIFVFYRQAAATVILAPFFILSSRKGVPRLSFVTWCKIFLLAFCGITFCLNANAMAVSYTSATFVAAAGNIGPVAAFVWAVLFRMEVVNLKNLQGNAKIMGVLFCIVGSATMALYSGPRLKFLNHLSHRYHAAEHFNTWQPRDHWVLGAIIIVVANLAWSLWLVLQGRFLQNYPSKLHFTTLQNFFSTFQSFFVAVMVERDFSRWKLGLNLQLLTVAYCGVFVGSITYYLQVWCIEKKGPVFVAVFMPLSLVLTTILSAFILGEVIHLGSIVGGMLMIVGLYCVLWGKKDSDGPSKSAPEEGKACFQDDEIAVQINH